MEPQIELVDTKFVHISGKKKPFRLETPVLLKFKGNHYQYSVSPFKEFQTYEEAKIYMDMMGLKRTTLEMLKLIAKSAYCAKCANL